MEFNNMHSRRQKETSNCFIASMYLWNRCICITNQCTLIFCSMQQDLQLHDHSHTFPHRSSLATFACPAVELAAGPGVGRGAGAEPQSPKSSSGVIFGGAAGVELNFGNVVLAGGVGSPQPPISATDPHPDCCVDVEAGAGAAVDLLQSGWTVLDFAQFGGALLLVVLDVGSGELPQPKSAPVADLSVGLATDRPVTGVATAGSLVFHSLEAHGSLLNVLKVVFVGGADVCINAL